MAFEFFQIPASGQGAGKEELNRLLRSGRIASVRKEFVANGEESFWAFCVEVVDGRGGAGAGARGKASQVDYKEVLSDADFAIFSRLRTVRKSLAEKEAIPAYSVATNEQLAEMVTSKAKSLSALGAIPGFGEARVSKYGAAFLDVLTRESSAE